jgi:hypothetical protein
MKHRYDIVKPKSGTLYYDLYDDDKSIELSLMAYCEPFSFRETPVLPQTDYTLHKELAHFVKYQHPIIIEWTIEDIESLKDLEFRCLQDSEILNCCARMIGSPIAFIL